MRTDYTVSAHDISIFDKYSVVFVRCTDNNQQLEVIAQWSKAQISNLVVVTDWVSSYPIFCTYTFKHYIHLH